MSPKSRNWFIKMVLPFATWLIPFFTWWVGRQEKRILKEGVEMTEEEKRWAASVGVENVHKVRLLYVHQVPMPAAPVIHFFANLFKAPVTPIGMAARYGIYLNQDSKNDPSLLVHELVHVAQYERLGGIKPFLYQYINEWITVGYWNAELELEARGAAIPFNRPPDR